MAAAPRVAAAAPSWWIASQLMLVRSIHAGLLLFILVAPFCAQELTTLLLHVLLLLAILMHWIAS